MAKNQTNNSELKQEIEDLKERIAAIEKILGIGQVQTEDSSNPPPPPPPPPR